MCWLQKFERTLLVFGLLALGIYVGGLTHRFLLSRAALYSFESEHQSSVDPPEQLTANAKMDVSLWSSQRIKGYESSLAVHLSPAIGILRIPQIHLEAPIFEGTDEVTLNRGLGRILGTNALEDTGNTGIAGHRDGFFRGLKDVALADEIEVVTPWRTKTFIVDQILIVDPQDISVLKPRERPSLTLVTCYPFYFIGSAPQRYIVQGSLVDFTQTDHVAKE